MSKSESFKRIVRAKSLKGDIVNTAFEHECRPEVCNPESEEMLIAEQMLDPPVVLRDFYVCRYMQSHYCTAQHCNAQEIMTGACRISGACYAPPGGYSSYDKNNPMTWHAAFRSNEQRAQSTLPENRQNKQAIRAEAKRQKVKKGRVRTQITELVTRLLFSSTRKQVNEIHKQQQDRRIQRDIQTYIKACDKNREYVNLIYIAMLKTCTRTKHRDLVTFQYDEEIVRRYSNIVLRVQKLVKKYHTTIFKVDTLTLGVLYEMRQGFMLNHTWLIPSDQFLCFNLPPINDLPHFRLKKKRVTLGQKMIELALKKAIGSGDPIEDIIVE